MRRGQLSLLALLLVAIAMFTVGITMISSPTGKVTENNNAPDWTGPTSVEITDSVTLDLSEHFFDVDFDELTYFAGNTTQLTATISGNTLEVTVAEGFHHETLTVYASDGTDVGDAEILFYAPGALDVEENDTEEPVNETKPVLNETINETLTNETVLNETEILNETLNVTINETLTNETNATIIPVNVTVTLTSKDGTPIGLSSQEYNEDGSVDIDFIIPAFGIASAQPLVSFDGLRSDVDAKLDALANHSLNTLVFAAQDVEMESATITLTKQGPVTAIMECPDFDLETFTCPSAFQQSEIEFTDNGNSITFTVSHFSGYAGAGFSVADASCGSTINVSHVLNASLSCATSWLLINGSNLFVDCNGTTVTYDTNGVGAPAITVNNRTNVTIRNCNILDGNMAGASGIGINLSNTTNSRIFNNTILVNGTSGGTGILIFQNSSRNNILANNITVVGNESSHLGVYLFGSANAQRNNITNNSINVSGSGASSNYGVISASSANTTINGNSIFVVNGYGFTNANVGNNTFTGNVLTGVNNTGVDASGTANPTAVTNNNITAAGGGIQVQSGTNHRFVGNRIIVEGIGFDINSGSSIHIQNNEVYSRGHGIYLTSTTNNNFSNIRINGAENSSFGIRTVLNSSNFTHIILNNTRGWFNLSAFVLINITNLTFQTPNGSLNIPNTFQLNGTRTINRSHVDITGTGIRINSSNLSFLNVSSTLRFTNVAFGNPNPTYDVNDNGTFVACPTDTCTEQTFSAGVFTFNVSHFSGFGIADGGGGTLNNCSNISTAGAYLLTNSVLANTTCFGINVSDVVLDCDGFNITYGIQGIGAGVDALNATNATIRNCLIRDGNATHADSPAINFTRSGNGTIYNNTIQTNGTSNNPGVRISGSSNTTVERNVIRTNGSTGNDGILVRSTGGFYATSNSVVTHNLVDYNSSPNSPGCNNATGILNTCQTCFDTAGVDCAFVGQGGCSDGEGFKTDDILNFSITGTVLSGRIEIIGGEAAICSLNGNDVVTVGTRNNCGSVGVATLSPAAFSAGNNTLQCRVAGSGSDEDNGFKLSRFTVTERVVNVLTDPDTNSTGSIIRDNTLIVVGTQGNNIGINIQNGPFGHYLLNNNITVNGSGGSYGIRLTGNSSFLQNNSVRTFGNSTASHGLMLENAFNHTVANNSLRVNTSQSASGVRISGGGYNTFIQNRFNTSANASIAADVLSSNNNTFINNTINNTYAAYKLTDSLNTTFNISRINRTQENGTKTLIIQEDYGIIEFTGTLNITNRSRLSDFITINNTPLIRVNTTANEAKQFNVSANITFLNVYPDAIVPRVDNDDTGTFADCGAARCTRNNFGAPANGVFTVNVSSFSGYTLRNTTGCVTIDTDNSTYVPEADVTGGNTCFVIRGYNITLDCNGTTVQYDAFGTGADGVNITNASNITVKNCFLWDITLAGSGAVAVISSVSGNVTVRNNTLRTNGTSATGVSVANPKGKFEIEKNNVSGLGDGISISNSHPMPQRHLIIYNLFNTNNTAIRLNTVLYTDATNNTINVSDTGINIIPFNGDVEGLNHSLFADNNITVSGDDTFPSIMYLQGTNNFTFRNNRINLSTTSSSSTIIDAFNNHHTLLENNVFTIENAPGTRFIDAVSFDNSDNLRYINNTAIVKGTHDRTSTFFLDSGNNSFFANNSFFFANGNESTVISSNLNATVIGNYFEINATEESVAIEGWYFNNISNNTIIIRGIGPLTGIWTFDNSTITNNNITTINGSAIGMQLDGDGINASDNILTMNGSSNLGIKIESAGRNSVVNNTIINLFGPNSTGLDILNGTHFYNTNITLTRLPGTWVYVQDQEYANLTNTTFNTIQGSIRYPGLVSINTSNTTNTSPINASTLYLNVSSNRAFVNSSNVTHFNASAFISLYGLAFTNPTPIFDSNDDGIYENCTSPRCTEVSYAGGISTFNVSGFTSYSTEETVAAGDGGVLLVNLTNCTNISSSGVFMPNASFASNGTCFTINASDVTLDCNGTTITYGIQQSAAGIFIFNRTNVTIKNCIIRDGNATHASSYGLNITYGGNHTIFNNTIQANGTTDNDAIRLAGVSNTTIERNTLRSNGTTNSDGLSIYSAGGDVITGINTVFMRPVDYTSSPNSPSCNNATGNLLSCKTCFTTAGVGCAFLGQTGCTDGGGFKTDTPLNFSVTGTVLSASMEFIGGEVVDCFLNDAFFRRVSVRNTCGAFIKLTLDPSLFIVGNNSLRCRVAGNGDEEDNGFKLSRFTYTERVTTTSIFADTNSTQNIIRDNFVNVTGLSESNTGLNIFNAFNGHSIFNNNITVTSLSGSHGIFLGSGANSSVVQNNTVRTFGNTTGSHALVLEGSHNNTIANNSLTSNTTQASSALYLTGSSYNTFITNNFTAPTNGSIAVDVVSSHNSTFIRNVVNFNITFGNRTYAGMRLTNSLNTTLNESTLNTTMRPLIISEDEGRIEYLLPLNITNRTRLADIITINATPIIRTNTTTDNGKQFNVSANLTFYNTFPDAIVPQIDITDNNTFADCGPAQCTKIDGGAFTSGSYSYNVSGWSGYSIRNVSGCITFDTNGTYVLETNVTANTGCMLIKGENLTFDCNGSIIYYDATGVGGDGVTVYNSTNVTIKNCVIIDINSGGASGFAVFLNNATNVTVINNTLHTNGTSSASGLFGFNLFRGGINAYDNLVRIHGTSGSNSNGIDLSNGNNNSISPTNIERNNITANDTAIEMFTMHNLRIIANQILANETSGIYVTDTNHTQIINNSIRMYKSQANGITIDSFLAVGRNTTISGNYIFVNTSATGFGSGIDMDSRSINGSITDNWIEVETRFANWFGIHISDNRDFLIARNNITMRAFSDGEAVNGIFISNSLNHSLIENNTIVVNGTQENYGITQFDLLSSDRVNNLSIIRNFVNVSGNNTVGGFNYGINIDRGNASTVSHNRVYVTAEGQQNFGFSMSLNHSVVENNTIVVSGNRSTRGLGAYGNFNNVTDNTVAVFGLIDNSGYYVGHASGGYFDRNNVTINGTASTGWDMFNETFNNSILHHLGSRPVWILEYNNYQANFTNTTFNTLNTSVRFPGSFNLTNYHNVSSRQFNITYNRTYLNSTNLSFLNIGAFITFRDLPYADADPIYDPEDDGTFTSCPVDKCTEISYTAGVLTFNVSGFTTYASQEAVAAVGGSLLVNLTNCTNISNSGRFILLNSVSANTTCIGINTSHVELDCNGTNITYGIQAIGTGVDAKNVSNITVRNCLIRDGNATHPNSPGINFTTVGNSLIVNNTIITNGTNDNYGIAVMSTQNTTVLQNTIRTNGSTNNDGIRVGIGAEIGYPTLFIPITRFSTNYLVNVNTSVNSPFCDNRTGTLNHCQTCFDSGLGVDCANLGQTACTDSEGFKTDEVLNFSVTGTVYNAGIELIGGEVVVCTLNGNTILSRGTKNNCGTYMSTNVLPNAFVPGNNTLSCSVAGAGDEEDNGFKLIRFYYSAYQNGTAIVEGTPVELLLNSTNNTLQNNTIAVFGLAGDNVGINIRNGPFGNLIINNNVTVNGSGGSHGIAFQPGTNSSAVQNNTVRTFGNTTASHALFLDSSANNTVANNTFRANTSKASSSVYITGGGYHTFIRNNFTATGNLTTTVDITSSQNNTFITNTINYSRAGYRVAYSLNTTFNDSNFSGRAPLIVEEPDGRVEFTNNTLITNRTRLSDVINISLAVIRVNTTTDNGKQFNVTANLTFYNVFPDAIVPTVDTFDTNAFGDCPASRCTSFDNGLATGSFSYNVSGFSGYSFRNTTGCTHLDENGTYVLERNLTADGTCMFIEANNVTLDCNGTSILYDRLANGGDGVVAINVTNITIKNCEIRDLTFTGTRAYSVLLNGTLNSTVFNNTLLPNGTQTSASVAGIFLRNDSNGGHLFEYNTIRTEDIAIDAIGVSNNTDKYNHIPVTIRYNNISANRTGILASGWSNLTISNNTFYINGTISSFDAIAMVIGYNDATGGTMRNNIIADNNFTLQGIHLEAAFGAGGINATIRNNRIDFRGRGDSGDHTILSLNAMSNSTVTDNFLNITSEDADDLIYGIGAQSGANNTNIVRNQVYIQGIGSNDFGIEMFSASSSHDTNISDNLVRITGDTDDAVGIDFGGNNTILSNNNITVQSTTAGSIGLWGGGRNITLGNNTVDAFDPSGTTSGIALVSSARGYFIHNNTLSVRGETGLIGIDLGGANHTLRDNDVNVRTLRNSQGLVVGGASHTVNFTNDVISELNITMNGTDNTGLRLWNSSNGTNIDNLRIMVEGQNSTWLEVVRRANVSVNLTNATFATPNGSIRFPDTIIANSTNLTTQRLNVTFGQAYLNGTNASMFNRSAFITLTGLTLTDPQAIFDGEDDGSFSACAADRCTEVSYSGGTFTFNVSAWTAYRSQETVAADGGLLVNLTNCTNNVSAPGSYILLNNVFANQTCFSINASDVTLDCNGTVITYGIQSIATGVLIFNRTNVTVKNCIIRDGNASHSDSPGINITNSHNDTILNNSIQSNGTNDNYGVRIGSGINNTVSGNRIHTNGSHNNYGIAIGAEADLGLQALTTLVEYGASINQPACTNGTGLNSCKTCFDSGLGVACAGFGQSACPDGEGYKTDTLLNFSVAGTPVGGRIEAIGGENVVCSINGNFTILEFHVRNNCGTYASATFNRSAFTIGNNTLQCSVAGSGSEEDNGFKLAHFSYVATETTTFPNSSRNVIVSNTIRTNGTSNGTGIIVAGEFNVIAGNNITAFGRNASNHGIDFRGARNNTITLNNITAFGRTNNIGLLLTDSDVNNVTENRIITNGTNSSHGIQLVAGSELNLFQNNNVNATTNRTANFSDAFNIIQSERNTFINNTVNYTRTGFRILRASGQVFNASVLAGIRPLYIEEDSGILEYRAALNLSNQTNLSRVVNISQNSVWVNSTHPSGGQLNQSAKVTFNNIFPALGFNLTSIFDIEDDGLFLGCGSPRCTDISYVASVFSYNVSSFTNYSTQNASACATLDESGVYTLLNDVSTGGTCFHIKEDNITLDCGGFAITYAANGINGGMGINITTAKNVTIRDCVIRSTAGATNAYGVRAFNSSNVTLINISVTTSGFDSHAIFLDSTVNATLRNTSSEPAGEGLWINGSLVEHWRHDINGTNRVGSSNISYFGGIGGSPACPTTLTNPSTHHITVFGCNNVALTQYVAGDSITLVNSNLSMVNDSHSLGNKNGIRLFFVFNGVVRNNTITTNGTNQSVGIYAYQGGNNTLRDNNVSTNATARNHGVFMEYSVGSRVENNTVRTLGRNDSNIGLYFTSVNETVIVGNNISTNGTDFNVGILAEFNLSNDRIENNTIRSWGDDDDNHGISIDFEASNIIIHNNFIYTADGNGPGSNIDSFGIFTSDAANAPEAFRNITITRNVVITNTTNGDGFGIWLFAAVNSTIADNAVFTGGINGGGNYGIFPEFSENIIIVRNTVNTSGDSDNYGFLIDGTNNSLFENNTVRTYVLETQAGFDTANNGLYLTTGAHNNTFIGNIVIANGTTNSYAIIIDDSQNNTFDRNYLQTNRTDTASGSQNYAILFDGSGTMNGTFFNNTRIVGSSGWITSGANARAINFSNTSFETPNGSITLSLFSINVSTTIITRSLNISLNRTFINTSNLTFLNVSAVIRLNLSGLGFTDASPLIAHGEGFSYAACPADVCTDGPFSNNIYEFNVSHWTSFAAQGTAAAPPAVTPLTNCTNLSGGVAYMLLSNVTANFTCFGINASGVTLDCNGTSIFYDQNGTGADAIEAANVANITIKNCFIQDVNASGAGGIAINFTDVDLSFVINNTIITNGTQDGYGVQFGNASTDGIVRGNRISTGTTSGQNNHGIYIFNATRMNVTNNTINSTSSAFGIAVHLSQANESLVANNTISTIGSNSAGVRVFTDASRNQILENAISTITTNAWGVELRTTSNATVARNVINASIGVFAFGTVTNATIDSNNITGNTNAVTGILLQSGGSNFTITNNRVTVNGTSSTGIHIFQSSHENTIRNNVVNATGARGIVLDQTSNDNRYEGNNITTSGIGQAISFGQVSVVNRSFFNNTRIVSDHWIGTNAGANVWQNFTNTTFITSHGSIRLSSMLLNNSENVTTGKLNITFNRAFLNVSNLTQMNTSAVIALNNLTFSTPEMVVDYADLGTNASCPADTCTQQSYSGGVFTFNVSHWTTFAAQEFTNASIFNSTITNCTFTNSTATSSNKTNCTAINSTNIGCTVLNSTEINVLCIGSNITNSTKINSTNINCNITGSFENTTTCTNSTKTNSIDIGSNITNSTITNSTIINCTVTNSIINDSTKTNCTITNSVIIRSNNTNTTIINSTEINSTDVNTFVYNSTILNSYKNNSIINNSNVTNSNISNCIVINSTIIDSIKTNCTIVNSIIIGSNNTNTTIRFSNETNSTDDDAIIINSSIFLSVKNGSFINNTNLTASNITNSSITNSTIINSSLTNCTVFNATVIGTVNTSCNYTSVTIIPPVNTSNFTNSTIINCNVVNSTINSSTKTNCTITNSTNNGCVVTNSTEINTFCTNSTKLNSTNNGCILLGTFENSSTCINSTKINSTVIGSTDTDCYVANTTETNVNCTNSTKTYSIVINSTNVGCIVTNSTEINTTCTNSNITNSTKISSVNTNCVLNGSYENNTICTNSTKTNSIDINSTITNSTVTNSTVINCTVTNSIVNNSAKSYCTITNSVIINSNNTNTTIINSTEINSTDINTFVYNSTILNSYKNNSIINNSNVTNSSLIGCIVINSTVIDSIKTNCTIINSIIIGSNNTNTTIRDSTERNSTDEDTLVINSTIILTHKNNSVINSSTTFNSNLTNTNFTGSNATNSNVSDSVLTNCTVINSTVIGVALTNCNIQNTLYQAFNTSLLTVSKSESADPIGAGSELIYSILLTSNGTGNVYNITVNETYPAEVTFLNASPPPAANNVTFSVPTNLTPGSIYTINITVNVSVTATGTFTNNVNATFRNETGAALSVLDAEPTAIAGGGGSPGGGGGGTPCTESWSCGAWTTCSGNVQTRTCTDANACGTTTAMPSTTQSCTPCVESWFCDDWSDCDGGSQNRDCVDMNACGTTASQPSTTQSCAEGDEEEPVVEEPGAVIGGNTAVACGGLSRNTSSRLQATRTGVDITNLVPRGYQLATEPFKLSCDGEQVDLTLNVPDSFTNLQVLRCTAETCSVEQLTRVDYTAQVCEDQILRSRSRSEAAGERGVFTPEQLLTFVSNYKDLGPRDTTLRNDGYSFTIVDAPVRVRLLSLNFPIPEPSNPSLVVLGTPVIVDFASEPLKAFPATVTMPVSQSKGVERGSVAIYALVDGAWKHLGGTQVGDHITVKVADFKALLDEKNQVVLATLGVTCTACEVAAFERAYHSPGTRTAIVLVHGAFSNKETYNFMIDDFRRTHQPFDVWTYDYPANLSLEQLGTNLADALLLNANRYDSFYLVGHSAGGLIIQQALYTGDQRNDITISKVKKAILVASPTLGSPTVETMNNLLDWLIQQKSVSKTFNLNSRLIQDTITGKDIPRVPDVDYQVVAGTQSYAFNTGLFTVTSDEIVAFTMKNDGIITVQSAQRVGDSYINNPCKNYYELNLTHTALIDEELGIRVVERIITTDIGESTAAQPLVGQDQYVKFTVTDCDSADQYAVIGKPLRKEERYDPTGCACGNGWCGEGETPENCPSDCGTPFTLKGACASAPVLLGILVAALAVAIGAFFVQHYIRKREMNTHWLYSGTATVLITLALLLTLKGVCSVLPLALLLALIVLAAAYIAAIFIEKRHRHGLPPLPKPMKHVPHEEPRIVGWCKGFLKSTNRLLLQRSEKSHREMEVARTDIDKLNRELSEIKRRLKRR